MDAPAGRFFIYGLILQPLFSIILFQFIVYFIRYRFAPFVFAVFSRNFHCNMGKPAIFFRSMPVLYLCRNSDHRTRCQADRLFSLFLVPSLTCCTDQKLSATFCRMMNMPVIAAPRLKRNICHKYCTVLWICQWIQIRITDKILCKSCILRSCSKYVLFFKLFFTCSLHNKITPFRRRILSLASPPEVLINSTT